MDTEKKAREREAELTDKMTLEVKEKQDLSNLYSKEHDTVLKLR